MKSLHEGKELLSKFIKESAHTESKSEAQTRFHCINFILAECFNWKGLIEVEQQESGNGFTDYELGNPRKVVIEAKREGVVFEIPAGLSKQLTISMRTLLEANKPLRDAIEQAQGYCACRGVPIAVISAVCQHSCRDHLRGNL